MSHMLRFRFWAGSGNPRDRLRKRFWCAPEKSVTPSAEPLLCDGCGEPIVGVYGSLGGNWVPYVPGKCYHMQCVPKVPASPAPKGLTADEIGDELNIELEAKNAMMEMRPLPERSGSPQPFYSPMTNEVEVPASHYSGPDPFAHPPAVNQKPATQETSEERQSDWLTIETIPAPPAADESRRLVWADECSRWMPYAELAALRRERKAHGMTWEEWMASEYPERLRYSQSILDSRPGYLPYFGYQERPSWMGHPTEGWSGLRVTWDAPPPNRSPALFLYPKPAFQISDTEETTMKTKRLYEVKLGDRYDHFQILAMNFGEALKKAEAYIQDKYNGDLPTDYRRITSIEDKGEVQL